MVLQEIGTKLLQALDRVKNANRVDDAVFTRCISDISNTLLQADVNIKQVITLREGIKRVVDFSNIPSAHNKYKVIRKAVFTELCNLLDVPQSPYTLQKRKTNVVMFVGLQGSGKTTTCCKYAYHYKNKGFKPALVCADTFRAGAFDQMKQNATRIGVPFYGSYSESDPVEIAVKGIKTFKETIHDLIIVDTSGRHMQEAALFEEMRQLAGAVSPDLVVFVMDSSIGQAAASQAWAFSEAASVGAVIITKMDGQGKGGGALAAVKETNSPVIFIGTGEHMENLQPFEVNRFVTRLMGSGDIQGLVESVNESVPLDQQEEMIEKLSQGKFTMNMMVSILSMTEGGIESLLSKKLLPPGRTQETALRKRKFKVMACSMTDEELDNPSVKFDSSRVMRIARGSGRRIEDVYEMIDTYKSMSKTSLKDFAKCGSNLNQAKKMLKSRGFDVNQVMRMLT